jgi:hypothetical protein
MAIQLKSYSFDGPFDNVGPLRSQPGVYAILGKRPTDTHYRVIDIGESHSVRERVENHDRVPCWKGQQLPLSVAAYHCDETARTQIEQELRAHFNPPCGQR